MSAQTMASLAEGRLQDYQQQQQQQQQQLRMRQVETESRAHWQAARPGQASSSGRHCQCWQDPTKLQLRTRSPRQENQFSCASICPDRTASQPIETRCERLARQPKTTTAKDNDDDDDDSQSRLLPADELPQPGLAGGRLSVVASSSLLRNQRRPSRRNSPTRTPNPLILLMSIALGCSGLLLLLSCGAAAATGDLEQANSGQRRRPATPMDRPEAAAHSDGLVQLHDSHANCHHHSSGNSHKSQKQHHRHLYYNQIRGGSSRSIDGSKEHRGRPNHQQPDAEAQQQLEPRAGPNGARESRRPPSLGGDLAAPNYREASESARPACDGCLAIPLVALLDGRQINGFILPPASLQRQQHRGDRAGPAERQSVGAHRLPEGPQRQQPDQAAGYASYQRPARASLDPKSDELCPMTGPLTVCDHIGSYPTDVILDKLDSAKRLLGESHFDLDSFFSDERDNSGDPFDDQRTHFRPHQDKAARAHRENGTILDSEYPPANIYSHQAADGAVEEPQHEQQQPKGRPPRANTKRYREAGGGWQAADQPEHSAPLSQRPVEILAGTSRLSAASKPEDDFVDLVERQAISLAERTSHLEPADDRRPLSGRQPSEQTRGKTTKTTKTASSFGRHNSLEDSERRHDNGRRPTTRSAQLRPDLNSTGFTFVGANNAAYAAPSQPASEAATKTRRSRRQVGAVGAAGPASASQSEPQPQPESESDTDGDSSRAPPAEPADSSDNQAEPLCRARSIYISPRAALNDKKQWKYVVNAPERDPQIRQIIRVDICQNPFGACSGQVSIPFGFVSECKQKYSKKKLLALDSKSGLLAVDTFFIPSCCVCQLIRTPLSSLGAEDDFSAASQPEPPAAGQDDTTDLAAATSAPATGTGEDDGSAASERIDEVYRRRSSGRTNQQQRRTT